MPTPVNATLAELKTAPPRSLIRYTVSETQRSTAVVLDAGAGILEVKRNGKPVKTPFRTVEEWVESVSAEPTLTFTVDHPEPSQSQKRQEAVRAAIAEKRPIPVTGRSDMQLLRGAMRRCALRVGTTLVYEARKKNAARHKAAAEELEKKDPVQYHLTICGHKNIVQRVEREMQEEPTDWRNEHDYAVTWSRSRLFVLYNNEMQKIGISKASMAGNYPFEHEGKELIIYGERFGTTFEAAGVPVGPDGLPNLWGLYTLDGDPKRIPLQRL